MTLEVRQQLQQLVVGQLDEIVFAVLDVPQFTLMELLVSALLWTGGHSLGWLDWCWCLLHHWRKHLDPLVFGDDFLTTSDSNDLC